jgi:hypothetical protein
VWTDFNRPSAGTFSFVTSSTAPVGSANPGSAVGLSTKPIASGTNGKAGSTDVVGSNISPFRGTLADAVDAAGKATLRSGGKAVSRLKSGRYTFRITDASTKSGFTIQEIRKAATTVTGTTFVGSRSKTIVLSPGQRMLSRRSLLKGGGALVVALGVSGGAAAGSARAEASPFDSNGLPDLMQADSYLVIHADSTAAVKTGRVELGQGSMTGLLLLAAEELDMDLGQLEFVRHDTNVTPNTGGTFGSSSISVGGQKLRAAAAAARQALLGLASASRFRR